MLSIYMDAPRTYTRVGSMAGYLQLWDGSGSMPDSGNFNYLFFGLDSVHDSTLPFRGRTARHRMSTGSSVAAVLSRVFQCRGVSFSHGVYRGGFDSGEGDSSCEVLTSALRLKRATFSRGSLIFSRMPSQFH